MDPETSVRHLEEIRAMVAEISASEPGDIGDEEPLLGERLDSIGVLSLATRLEDRYGITIGAHEMDPANFGSLRRIAAFVAGKSTAA